MPNFPNILLTEETQGMYLRDHSFSAYAQFSEKLTFLTPGYARARVRIRG